jgi:hypothetical protein
MTSVIKILQNILSDGKFTSATTVIKDIDRVNYRQNEHIQLQPGKKPP